MRQQFIFAWCFLTLFVAACGDPTSQRDDAYNLDEEALTQLAGDAFTFAYPLVEQYRMMVALTHPQSPAFGADFNQFSAGRALLGPETTFIIRPNADTLYGGVFLDDNNFTFPLAIGVQKTTIIGGRPWKFGVQYWHYVESPELYSPDWQIRLSISKVVSLPW